MAPKRCIVHTQKRGNAVAQMVNGNLFFTQNFFPLWAMKVLFISLSDVLEFAYSTVIY